MTENAADRRKTYLRARAIFRRLVKQKYLRLPDGAYLVYPRSLGREHIPVREKIKWFDESLCFHISPSGEIRRFGIHGQFYREQIVRLFEHGGSPFGTYRPRELEMMMNLQKIAVIMAEAGESGMLLVFAP
jgi:hypothetical protein